MRADCQYQFDSKGIPILTLEEKLDALKTCMLDGSDEDAMGHLFDLINHLAPDYKFLMDCPTATKKFKTLKSICDYYGKRPRTPIIEAEKQT
jgi:hypothetical protein